MTCRRSEPAGDSLVMIATDIMGVSGRAMLAALVAGTTDPEVLAEMAKTRLRARSPELRKALNARFRERHGFLVSQILRTSTISTMRLPALRCAAPSSHRCFRMSRGS
jgi:hypothetical protein